MKNVSVLQGFNTLFKECLHLEKTDSVLIIYDESLNHFLYDVINVTIQLSMQCTFIFLPKDYQKTLISEANNNGAKETVPLPSGLTSAISTSSVIVNLIDGETWNSIIRKSINLTGRSRWARLATIPGISLDILECLNKSPIREIYDDCERIAWILGESERVELNSYDSRDNIYKLSLNLEGWDNEPIMSPGIFLPGSWGNVPPGETFCCPRFNSVNGQICINGSVPGSVLENNSEIILDFVNGKLVGWESENSQSPGILFLEKERKRALVNNDTEWNTFSELGIGLNPTITRLTGNALFDEKAKQTIHIAIGDNSAFGDNIRSMLHADMVTWKPDLICDGAEIISRGIFQSDTIDKMRMSVKKDTLVKNSSVRLRDAKVGKHENVFQRRLIKANRVNYVKMANEEISTHLSEVCQLLTSHSNISVKDFIAQHKTIQNYPILDLLEILNHYRVLHVNRK